MRADLPRRVPFVRRATAHLAARVLLAAGLACALLVAASGIAAAAPYDPWTAYDLNTAHPGDNAADPINANNAARLRLHWSSHSGGAVSSQPIVDSNLGLVFWGTWDGWEHAARISNGAIVWTHYLGITSDSSCEPPRVGVASTSALGSLNGTPVIYVGGGDAAFYALNAHTGALIWRHSLGSSPSHFIWSSPALYNGSVYIGESSFGDCPLVAGQLFQLSASNGGVLHVFTIVPSGCVGGGVWGSPAIDTARGYVYFATGNPGGCSQAEPDADAVLKVLASNVTRVLDRWQARSTDSGDLDLASMPTLYTATINGASHLMLGIGGKDGTYYALDRNAMSHGPLWRTGVAHGGSCPQCGNGVIAPSAYDGGTLYVAGGATAINGAGCPGNLSALSPSSGGFRWRHCLAAGPVLGAVSMSGSPGVIFVGQGTYLMGIAAGSGQTLFRYNTSVAGAYFWGAPSISASMVFAGNQNGNLYAFGF